MREIALNFVIWVILVSLVRFLVKPLVEKIESYRLSRSEFETIRLIGSGAFGEVSLVRSKSSNEYFALKSLHKYDMLKRSDVNIVSQPLNLLESMFPGGTRSSCQGSD